MKRLVIVFVAIMTTTGYPCFTHYCKASEMVKDALIGGIAGGAVGALAGQAIGHNTKSTVIGAGAGAGTGAIIGAHADNRKQQKEIEKLQSQTAQQSRNQFFFMKTGRLLRKRPSQ